MVAQALQVSATGDVTTRDAYLHSVVLTPDGTNAASLVVRSGGGSGPIVLSLRCLGTHSVATGDLNFVDCSGGIHATLTGTGAVAALVFS